MRNLNILRKTLFIALALTISIFQSANIAAAGTLIQDNGGPGTSSNGTWKVSGGVNPYGSNSLYASANGASYTFNADLPTPGEYQVFAWWTEYSNRRTSVPIDITHLGGTSTVTVNHRQNGGQWNQLGTTWNFGTTATITIRSLGNGTTSVDAIKLVYVANNTALPAFPVDLRGSTPEEASITINVSKPVNAGDAIITLATYDADFSDEGELIINGNQPVKLFGSAGISGNDQNSADITISTPASHWKDGKNTLRFRHTRTAGYIIDGVTVAFETGLASGSSGTGLDPLVLYTFNEGGGSTVRDVSGNGTPMDLAIQNTANTHWLADGGLSVDKPTFIRSSGSANKIINAIKTSNALTIEAWVQPANTAQSGPARIVTLSVDPYNRHFTLAQNKSAYDVRLRTTSTNSDGTPSLASPAGTLGTALTHVVYTRDSAGTARLYINGVKQSQKTVAGNLSNWTGSYGFALANEFNADRPWTGKYYQVAVYDHAINAADVNANYSIGPGSKTSSGGNTSSGESNTAPTISAPPPPPTQITPQTGSVSLNWTAPVARTNGRALAMSELAGYTVYYGTSKGNYPDSLSINNGSATTAIIRDLPVGTYYLVVTTRDTGGRESGYSSMVTKWVQ